MKNLLSELNLHFPMDYFQLLIFGLAAFGSWHVPTFFKWVLLAVVILFTWFYLKGGYDYSEEELAEFGRQYEEDKYGQ